jgi:hypothetical protein
MLVRFTPPRDFGPARPFFGADQAGSFRVAGDPPSGARSVETDSFLSDLVAIFPGVFQSERAGITRYPFSV